MKEEDKWIRDFPRVVPLVGLALGFISVKVESPDIILSDSISSGIGLGLGMSIAAAIAFAIAWSSRRTTPSEERTRFASRWAWAILVASFIAQLANSWRSDPAQLSKTEATPHGESMDSRLLVVANEVTRTAPKMIDADTRLDGAVAGPGLSFTYLFSLPNVASTDVAPSAFNDTMPLVRKSACGSRDIKELFFDNSVTVNYLYRGSDGKEIGTVTVTREVCAAR